MKPYLSFLATLDMISNVNSWAIVMSSIWELLAIVTSHWSIILTLFLWSLSSSQWHCQPWHFNMVAHRHDCHWSYCCVLLCFHGRIEVDHSYGLHWSGLCCHSGIALVGPAASGCAMAGPTRAVPEWQRKPLQHRPYRAQFLYPTYP